MKKFLLLIAVLITLAASGCHGSAFEKPATAMARSAVVARPWGLLGAVPTKHLPEAVLTGLLSEDMLTGDLSEADRDTVFAPSNDAYTAGLSEKYYVTSDFLNVRSGPGTDFSVLGSLTRGMKINVISMEGDAKNRWAKFRFEGLTAYALASHLSKDEP